MPDESQIKARLEEVLQSIFCPIAGCWPLHGCHIEFFHDGDAEAYVLEVWPTAVEEPEDYEGNGDARHKGLLYELAEFDFVVLVSTPLEHFHFSQQRSMFEIGWREEGQDLELRVHVQPVEVSGE